MKVQLYCCMCVSLLLLLFLFCPFNFYLKDDFRSCCSHRPTLWSRCVRVHTVNIYDSNWAIPFNLYERQRQTFTDIELLSFLGFLLFRSMYLLMWAVCTEIFKTHLNESCLNTVNLLFKMKATSNSRAIYFEIVTSFTSAHAIEHHHEHNYGRQLRKEIYEL